MTWVVDASVAAKWFVREDGHETALRLLDVPDDLAAPDLIVAEVGNLAWKKHRLGEVTRDQASAMAAAVPSYIARLVPSASLIERAMEIAFALDHPVYDCLYLACAEVVDGVLVTADGRLAGKVAGTEWESAVCRVERSHTNKKKQEHGLPLKALSLDRVEEAIRAWNLINQTGNTLVRKRANEDGSGVLPVEDADRFFQSPAIRRADIFMNDLTRDQRAEFIALGWLGQGNREGGWTEVISQAYQSVDEYSRLDVLALFKHLNEGLKSLRAAYGSSA